MIRFGVVSMLQNFLNVGSYGYGNKITSGEQFPQVPLNVPSAPPPSSGFVMVSEWFGI